MGAEDSVPTRSQHPRLGFFDVLAEEARAPRQSPPALVVLLVVGLVPHLGRGLPWGCTTGCSSHTALGGLQRRLYETWRQRGVHTHARKWARTDGDSKVFIGTYIIGIIGGFAGG